MPILNKIQYKDPIYALIYDKRVMFRKKDYVNFTVSFYNIHQIQANLPQLISVSKKIKIQYFNELCTLFKNMCIYVPSIDVWNPIPYIETIYLLPQF